MITHGDLNIALKQSSSSRDTFFFRLVFASSDISVNS